MKKIFYYPFLILFLALVFFSFGQKVFAETCPFSGGLEVRGSGQCSQASQELKEKMLCLSTKTSANDIEITIIGDETASSFDYCRTSWVPYPTCIHQANSCHYGGKMTSTGRTCELSHAIDIHTRTLSSEIKRQIEADADACGMNAFLENPGNLNSPPYEHIHASIGSDTCDCGETQSGGVIQNLVYQAKSVCIDFNTPIPGIQEFLTERCPYDETKYLVNSRTVGLYINAVYKYGAGLAGVMAMFMIVFAAWQWIIAAGNAGKIENAKDTIISALIGLALLFGGYLLLSQISSRLVDLGNLDVNHFDPKFLDVQQCVQIESTCGEVVEVGSALSCLGQKCSPGQACMEFSTGWTGNKCPILKDDLRGASTCGCQLPAIPGQINCDIFVGFSHSTCENYTLQQDCNNNFCSITDGPCAWDRLNNNCQQVDDASCNTDADCATVKINTGEMVDTCCDTDDFANNCEFPSNDPVDHCGD